jgi:hypothetical protein
VATARSAGSQGVGTARSVGLRSHFRPPVHGVEYAARARAAGSKRDSNRRQQVIATLGRYEDLQASGQLERLLRSGARFVDKAMVLGAVADDSAVNFATRRIGPALVFERLWEATGCRAVIIDLAGKRKHGFVLERAVFLTVLHRLFCGGSDRAADRWRDDYRIGGVQGLDLQPWLDYSRAAIRSTISEKNGGCERLR